MSCVENMPMPAPQANIDQSSPPAARMASSAPGFKPRVTGVSMPKVRVRYSYLHGRVE